MSNPILRNETSKVNWTLVSKTPHVIAYRLWTQVPGEDWVKIAEGTSEDGSVDSGEFDAKKDYQFAYSLGIGSTQAGSAYDVSIVLSQAGSVLQNGLLEEEGKVDDNGVGAAHDTVTFEI